MLWVGNKGGKSETFRSPKLNFIYKPIGKISNSIFFPKCNLYQYKLLYWVLLLFIIWRRIWEWKNAMQ